MTTNGAGALSWTNVDSLVLGNTNQTLRHNGTTWIATSNVTNDGNTLTTTKDAKMNGLTVGKGAITAAGGNAFNTAVGVDALRSNTTGQHNTALGYQTLALNGIGEKNTASGYRALNKNRSGNSNTASGFEALTSNETGSSNTGIGNRSLYTNTSGNRNTAIGDSALFSNTTGSNNVAIGDSALFGNTTASNNTAIGFNTSISMPSFSNVTVIGSGARATAAGQVMLGNTTVTAIGGYQPWSDFSDGRFKKNVEEKVIGLDFIMALRPVTYNLDLNALANFRETPNSMRSEQEERKAEQVLKTGFIAQEVELVAKKLGYDFSGVYAPQNEKDNYALRYSVFVVPLVKAMQEQQELIKKLQERIVVLENK